MNKKEREELFEKLYKERYNDYQIAEMLECSQTLVYKWRKKMKYASIYGTGGDRKSKNWREKIIST